jgi:two-component system, OmpR family, response regulator CpxR
MSTNTRHKRSGKCCPEFGQKISKKEQCPRTMRPKKVILCVVSSEQELSVFNFMLRTKGYKVLPATNYQEAIAAFSSVPQVDLVLADNQLHQVTGGQLLDRLKRMAGHVPAILLGEVPAGSNEIHSAEALIVRKNCPIQDLLVRIKDMSQRKRGPRKGAQRTVHAAEELAAAS